MQPPQSSDGPLAGVRVLALEQAVAAPLCTRHLADLGADVIKIEHPEGGDFARRYDEVVHGESAYFTWLNYAKRSVTLDLHQDADRATLTDLLAEADVFVSNLGPGAVDRLGFGWQVLHARWPRIVACAISGYGQEGPYRTHKAFDLLLQGESGLLSVTGTQDQPAKVGISIADIGAGMYALAAILAALRERDRSGVGSFLDIAMLDCLAEWMTVPTLYQRYGGSAPSRMGLHHATIAPYGPYRARNGSEVFIAVQNEGQWRRLCARVLDMPDLGMDKRFDGNGRRVANRAILDSILRDAIGAFPYREFIARLKAADVPFGSFNDVAALVAHPQLEARARWIDVATETGPAAVPRSPLGRPASAPTVPALGAHTDAVAWRTVMSSPTHERPSRVGPR